MKYRRLASCFAAGNLCDPAGDFSYKVSMTAVTFRIPQKASPYEGAPKQEWSSYEATGAVMTGFPIILALIAMVGPASTRPVDFQTVETLQIAYHDAVRASDATSIAGMYAAETKWERQVRDVLVRNDLAANRLRKAVEAELGVKLVGGGQYMAQDVSEWQVGQDSATVEGLNAQRAYPPLKKTKAGWKIDPFSWGIGWLVPPEKAGKDSPNQREMMAMLSREKWLDRVTARVQEGTYWRLEDVAKASSVGHVLDEMKGAATKPVKRPVTRPVKVDLSTPLAAYDTLAKALIQGDIAAMRQALAPNRSETPAQRESEERWLRTSCALHVAAVERFGAQGWKVGLQNGMEPHQVGMDLLTELDIAAAEDDRVKIHLDEAEIESLSYASGQLIRTGKEWKVRPVPKEDEAPEDPNKAAWEKIEKIITEAEERVAKGIVEGKFQTAEEAQALFVKMVSDK